MRHERFTPMDYKHQLLMDELNDTFINIKVHLFDIPINKPKPTAQELDELENKLMQVLKQDAKPFIKY